MKNTFLFSFLLCCILAGAIRGLSSQQIEVFNPCSLVTIERISKIFPALEKAEKQTVGQNSVCNYFDKYGIPALVVSVTKAGAHARDSLLLLGSGYKIEDISGLGDEAAIAVQQPNPKFGLQEGIAALHIKKNDFSLNFSFFRINMQQNSTDFEKTKSLAAEMLEKL